MSNKTYQQVKFLVNNNFMGIKDKINAMRKPAKRRVKPGNK